MKAIIVGGGKVGYYLINTLKDKKYDVVLIESNIRVCEKIAEEFEIEVINGDGTNIDILNEAGADNAEVVAAVTGKDAENFVICHIVNLNFDVSKTVARINNPKNREVFKALGVTDTVCSTEVIANIIDGELSNNKLKIIQTLDRGEFILVEANVSKKSSWKNNLLKNITMPSGGIIVSIFRNDSVIYPNGNVEIKENDKLLMVIPPSQQKKLEEVI